MEAEQALLLLYLEIVGGTSLSQNVGATSQ